MAKAFNALKSTKLGLLDKIMVGKLRDCRVCDVIETEYEYLIWLDKNGYVNFDSEVIKKIQSLASFQEAEEYYTNEVAPYLDIEHEDIPF